ncbi:MAG: hypothetical protein ACHQNE_03235, partial [Candidatus Kapaibacterium sp.]
MKRQVSIFVLTTCHLLLASGAFAQTLPTREMSFTITATRSITSNTDIKDTASSCGHSWAKDKSTITLHFSATSPKITFTDYGDDIQSPSRDFTEPFEEDQPFSGGGSVTYSGSNDHGIDCGDCKSCCSGEESSNWNVTQSVNMTGSGADFQYNFKQKQGTFNLKLALDDPQGDASGKMNTCDSQYLPSANPDIVKAGAKMLDAVFSQFIIQNFSTFGNLRIAQAMKDQMQKALDAGGNGGIATIAANDQGYTVGYSNTVTNTATPDGCTGSSTTTITTSVSVSIGGKPIEYDAVLVPAGTLPSPGSGSTTIGKYEDWEPEGPPFKDGAPVGKDGNSVSFKVVLVEKGHQDKPLTGIPFKVDYKLTSSSEPGIALNYPPDGSGQTDPDLQFNINMGMTDPEKIASHTENELISTDSFGADVPAIIESFDYGSYGTLSAKITLANGGSTYDAHLKDSTSTTINLPKDDNNNHISDRWELDSGIIMLDYAEDWDKVKQPNNEHDGDGFSLYEKYRGVIAKGKHIRLSPHFKNIIVANPDPTKYNFGGGIAIFDKAAKINVVEVKLGDELDPDKKVVNINNSTAHNDDQCGIKIEVKSLPLPPGTPSGYCFPGQAVAKGEPSDPQSLLSGHGLKQRIPKNPADVDALVIGQEALNDPGCSPAVNYAFAHELAHCLGVRHHGNSKPTMYSDGIARGTFKVIDESGKPFTVPQ